MLCLNAGAALLASEQVASLAEGVKLAHATLREGKAKQKLADVIACSRTHNAQCNGGSNLCFSTASLHKHD